MELQPSRKATLTKSSFHFRTCFPSSTSKSWFPVQNCRKLKAHLFLLFTCPPAPGILVLMAAARSTNQCQRGQQLAANWLPFPWVAFLAIVWFRSWEPWLQVSPVNPIRAPSNDCFSSDSKSEQIKVTKVIFNFHSVSKFAPKLLRFILVAGVHPI